MGKSWTLTVVGLVAGIALLDAAAPGGHGGTRPPLTTRPIPVGPGVRPMPLPGPVPAPWLPDGEPELPPRPGPQPLQVDVFEMANRGQLVLVGTLTKAEQVGPVAMSYPPQFTMHLTLEKVEALRGEKPAGAVFARRMFEGQPPAFEAGKRYLLTARPASAAGGLPEVVEIVEATDAHVAIAKKAVTLPLGWALNAKGDPVSPWAALGEKAWPKDVADPALASETRCAVTSRPALFAGADIALTVEQVPPKVKVRYQNDYGDGEFKVTVTNPTDKAVDVPALLTDGKNVLWAESLVIIQSGKILPAPGASGVTAGVKPVRLEPKASVSGVVNTLGLAGVSWPRGGSRVHFQFCLGELSAENFFYYYSARHDKMRTAKP